MSSGHEFEDEAADGGERNFVATMGREDDDKPLVVRFVAYDEIGLPGHTISIELRSRTDFADAVTMANLLNRTGLVLRIDKDPPGTPGPIRSIMRRSVTALADQKRPRPRLRVV